MLRNLLSHAWVYSFFEGLVGAKREYRLHLGRNIRARAGDRVLDIGCGPADILAVLPAVDYTGFDLSPAYIASARNRFGARGQFEVQAVSAQLVGRYTGFDLVLATGVIHHLADAEALDLFRVAQAALKPGGRLVTLDPCLLAGQPALARFFIGQDRGEHVRNQEQYLVLARQVFPVVKPNLMTDLLRIPYTHLAMECGGGEGRR